MRRPVNRHSALVRARGADAPQGLRRSPLLDGWGIALLMLLLAIPASAQRPQDRIHTEVAEEAISQIRSPYCPGFMLEVCPSPQAQALRDSIYDLAEQGMESPAIVEWMIANHGEEWRGLPKRSGAGLLAWLAPPLALLLGVLAFTAWFRSNRAKGGDDQLAESPQLSGEDREKLAAAMRDWEEDGQEVS